MSYRLQLLTLSLGLFLSQYYILPSGYVQPAHLLFVAFFLLVVVSQKGIVPSANAKIVNGSLYLFVFYVAFINLAWSLYYQDLSFNFFSVYLVYDLLLFFSVFSFLYTFQKFRGFLVAIFIALLALLLCWMVGAGEYKFGARYNGFFNDPNQMAFWVLCCCSTFLLLNKHGYKYRLLLFFIAVVLIMATMSRSALVGLAFIFAAMLCGFYKDGAGSNEKRSSLRLPAAVILTLVFVSLSIFVLLYSADAEDVVQRFASTDIGQQADIRGYGRLFNFSEYLFFGAGQAFDERFGHTVEIHSTWVAFLFYYGIIGFSLFCVFIIGILKKLTLYDRLIAAAPLVYGFSTFGARTPVFWIFLASLYYVSSRYNRE
ncbi:MAG: hypothetical protein ABGX98_11460 [Pseudomonadota bacterium]